MEWEAVLGRQSAVACRSQLYAAGLTTGVLRAHLRAGRWTAFGRRVVVAHNGDLTGVQRQWVAVLGTGAGAVLAARSALVWHGLGGWPAPVVEVLVAKGTRVLPLPGIHRRVHESRRFHSSDVRRSRGLPIVRVERAAVDAAAWSAAPRSACGLLAAVVQQRLSTADRLVAELEAAGPVRHAPLLRTVLADIAGGAQALSEVDFGDFCRRHGLPAPVRQVVRLDAQGRRRYVDAELSLHGHRVLVEIDGAVTWSRRRTGRTCCG